MGTEFFENRGMDMDTEFFENCGVDMVVDTEIFRNRGVDMDMDTEIFENRGVDMDMDTAWNRCPPNSGAHLDPDPLLRKFDRISGFKVPWSEITIIDYQPENPKIPKIQPSYKVALKHLMVQKVSWIRLNHITIATWIILTSPAPSYGILNFKRALERSTFFG